MNFSDFISEHSSDPSFLKNREKLESCFEKVCQSGDDFVQLYELKNILEVTNVFERLLKAREACGANNGKPLFEEIERISDELERHSISCFSYAYFLSEFLSLLFSLDESGKLGKKRLDMLDYPPKISWKSPSEFDYASLKSGTFGMNKENKSKKTAAYPNCDNFEISDHVLQGYKGTKKYVIVPEGVTEVEESAFQENENLRILHLPESVTAVNGEAFSNCPMLARASFGKGVKELSDGVFKRCENLVSFSGKGVETIGENAFLYCANLKHLEIGRVKEIGRSAFEECVALTDPSFLSDPSLTSIGETAFSGCSFEKLSLGYLDYLGDNAFSSCEKLKEINLLGEIVELGETPFYGCSEAETLNIKYPYSGEVSSLFGDLEETKDSEEGSFPVRFLSLRTLSKGIASNLDSLEEVKVSDNESFIPERAFANCPWLGKIEFGNRKIDAIEKEAFLACDSLESLDIDYSGRALGDSAFYGCKAIKDFSFLDSVKEFGEKSLSRTDLTGFNFEREFNSIGRFAFANSKFPSNMNIKLNGTKVGPGAFHGAHSVASLEIRGIDLRANLIYALFEKTINEFREKVKILSLSTDCPLMPFAFANYSATSIACKVDENGVLPRGLFCNSPSLERVSIEGRISRFGPVVFKKSPNLHLIQAEISPELEVGDEAFMDCKDYEFPFLSKTKSIGERAFFASGLKSFELREDLAYIGDEAFAFCPLVSKKIVLPFLGNSLESEKPFGTIFAHSAGEGTHKQEIDENQSYYVPESIEEVVVKSSSLPEHAFKNCSFLRKIELPNLLSLASPCLEGCTGLKELVLGPSLKEFDASFLRGVGDNLALALKDNPNFLCEDGSLYSLDGNVLYYGFSSSLGNARIFKAYSVRNYAEKMLELPLGSEVESNAFDLSKVETLSIKEASSLGFASFANCQNLKDIDLSFLEDKELPPLFSSKSSEISLERLCLTNVRFENVLSLFVGVSKLHVKNLYLSGCDLQISCLEGVEVEELYLTECKGRLSLGDLNRVSVYRCAPLSEMFASLGKVGTLEMRGISELCQGEFNGLSFENLDLEAVTIRKGAFEGIEAKKVIIHGVQEIEPGAFSRSKIEDLRLEDSSEYSFDGESLISGNKLIYFRPRGGRCSLPRGVRNVPEGTVDLTYVKSLDVGMEGLRLAERCFYNTSGLESLVCRASETKYLINLFSEGLPSLKELTFLGKEVPPKYLTQLEKVTEITLEKDVFSVGDFAFADDPALTRVTNLEKASLYGDFLFLNCSSLSSLTLNDKAKSIGMHIAENCLGLKSVQMPLLDYYEDLEWTLFDLLGGSTRPNQIKITSGDVAKGMFENTNAEIAFLSSPRRVGERAFAHAGTLSIDLKATKSVLPYAFEGVNFQQKKLNMPECESIGERAFSSCSGLAEISLGSKLEEIGTEAFFDTPLSRLTVEKNERYRMEQDCLFEDGTLVYFVPNGKTSDLSFEKLIPNIRKHAFSYCQNLHSVSFAKVAAVEEGAFCSCSGLTEVSFGNSSFLPGGAIFFSCCPSSLSLYKIEQGQNKILRNYFSSNAPIDLLKSVSLFSPQLSAGELGGFSCLEKVVLGDNVKVLPDSYFEGCSSLKEIKLPDSLRSIGKKAFAGCSSLKAITIPPLSELTEECFTLSSLESIRFQCNPTLFSCERYGVPDTLKEVYFDSIVSFAKDSFKGKKSLTKVAAAGLKGDVSEGCFSGCSSLTQVTLPCLISSIKKNAFFGCSSLTEISWNLLKKENSFALTEIGENAFFGCTLLSFENKEFFASLTSIGPRAFASCKLPSQLDFSKNNIHIGALAFANSSLTSLRLGRASLDRNALDSVNLKTLTFTSEQLNFSAKKLGIGESLTSISFDKDASFEAACFADRKKLSSVQVANLIGSVPKGCFSNCSSLSTLHLDSSKPLCIEEDAFSFCTSLGEVPSSCRSIASFAFKGCSALKLASLEKIEELGAFAFEDCTKLKKVTLGAGLRLVPNGVFQGCSSLKEVVLPNGLEEIGRDAFAGTNLKELVFPSSLRHVGATIFRDNSSPVKVHLPEKEAEFTKGWEQDWNEGFKEKKFLFFHFKPKAKIKTVRTK